MYLKPNQDRAKLAIVIIYIILFVSIAFALSNYSQLDLLENAEKGIYNFEDASANDTRQQFIAILLVLLNIVSAVTFIMWFRRAYHNLQLAGESTKYDHGWAAGAWFIPILNFFRPYEIMKELFVKSNYKINSALGGQGDQNYKVKIGLWWAIWIFGTIYGAVITRLPESDTMEYYKNITFLTLIDAVFSVASCIITIVVIKAYKEQELLLEEAAAIRVDEIGMSLVSE